MAGKKRRRPGGHPAKIAARRERDERRAGGRQELNEASVRGIAERFASLKDAISVELNASGLLGTIYPEEIGEGDNPEKLEEETFLPLVDALGKLGDEPALAALWALGEVSSTNVGVEAVAAVDRLRERDIKAPAWGHDLQAGELVRAAEMHEPIFDDGFDALLEFEHGGARSVVAVAIDNNFGGVARGIYLAESIDQLAEIAERRAAEEGGELRMQVVDVEQGEVAGRILHAIAAADRMVDFRPDENFRSLRSLARHRAFCAVGLKIGDERLVEALSDEELGDILDKFVASEPAAQLAGVVEGEAVRSHASLALTFSTYQTANDVLCWSPVKLEHFMLGWLPAKMPGGTEKLKDMPAVLKALVEFAGRQRAVPETLLAECANRVDAVAPKMFDLLDAPGSD
jgi:hypothetical protein